MKTFLALFANFLLVVHHAPAQSTLRDDKLILKVTPALSFRDLGVRMGVEFKLTQKIGLQAEMQIPVWIWNDYDRKTNLRFYQIRGEARYYYSYKPKENGASFNYVAVEGFYLDRRFDLEKSYTRNYYYTRTSEVKRFDDAAVRQQIWVAALKCGKIWSLGKRFSLDFHVGIGVRFYNNRYQTVNEIDSMPDPPGGFDFDTSLQEGKGEIRPQLALGLKVAYRIW